MSRLLKIVLVIIVFLCCKNAKADSWIDPTWKRMLDSSDVIALVQYTSNGDFRAKAKILTIYKGQLKIGDEIWISGFSNRYGPIDKMKTGDTYLVFLGFNQPDENGSKYLEEESKKNPQLKDFFEGYKNNKAYYVWSPTSGDLKVKGKRVQYSLVSTTTDSGQPYYPLKEFEDFLRAYHDPSKKNDLFSQLLSALRPASESDVQVQYLMQLYLLGYNRYNDIYNDYARVSNESAKYALAQLMGNIRTTESRELLIALLDDESSLVQGEVVRQLRNESPDIVAPILLKRLKTASGNNFGPSNIMDPVMNHIDGGKAEIIQALGELKYKPAISDLLSLLNTTDEGVFRLVIAALKNIGTREYIPYINKHLDNKTDDLIFTISMMIAEDSLVECLPSFKNFISTCDRDKRYDYTVSTCCGIGHFTDSETISFLLSDYKHFFTYKDSLHSFEQREWTEAYISTFADLKVREARPLVYKSVYDWHAVNEDFGQYPKLFDIKKRLEDSLKKVFANDLGKKNYLLNYCMAFIENTKDVIRGASPMVKYLIEITIPASGKSQAHEELILKTLNLPEESVYLRGDNGVYYNRKEDRFDSHIYSSPLYYFLNYASAVPDSMDIIFLQGLLDNGVINDERFREDIKNTIAEIKSKLGK